MKIPKPIHPFPARMAASIPWSILEKLPQGGSHRVLDPMSGSGTTLVIARKLGHKALGVDADPLAVMMASAWCSDVDENELVKATHHVAKRSFTEWTRITAREAYPTNSDAQTDEFVRYWFDSRSRKQLTALGRAIADIKSPTIRKLLWCGFSRLIVVKQCGASLAMDVSHSRPHRAYTRAPLQPVSAFSNTMLRMMDALPFKCPKSKALPKVSVRLGDARALHLEDQSIDVVITSPPYLNAIDYMRGHKLSLVWMEHSIPELRQIRSSNIGAEAALEYLHKPEPTLLKASSAALRGGTLSDSHMGMFIRYLSDMRRVLTEVRRVLKKRGQASFVVGNSTLRGTFVANSEAIKALAAHVGLTLVSQQVRSLPENRRYLPPPQSKNAGSEMAKRMRQEAVLQFVST